MRILACGLTVLALAVRPVEAQETKRALPEGVTDEMITQGAALYKGQGLCMACHGQDGKGMPNLGADLTDATWVHSDGSFAGILATIQKGVTADKSTTGTVMPPKGGSALSEAQLKAVAAYVWSLSRKP
jgi:cbb3-type cytochrome c oxidase subunit III